MSKIYEAVDHTSDETYYTRGVWLDLETATAEILKCDPEWLNEDGCPDTDYLKVVIWERPIGLGDVRKEVAVFEWNQRYDEDRDEYIWEMIKGETAACSE